MSRDYETRLGKYLGKKKTGKKVERYSNVRIKNGDLTFKDNIVEVLDTAFNSLDLVVNNTSYTAEYLKSIYVVEFFKIIEALEKRIKTQ